MRISIIGPKRKFGPLRIKIEDQRKFTCADRKSSINILNNELEVVGVVFSVLLFVKDKSSVQFPRNWDFRLNKFKILLFFFFYSPFSQSTMPVTKAQFFTLIIILYGYIFLLVPQRNIRFPNKRLARNQQNFIYIVEIQGTMKKNTVVCWCVVDPNKNRSPSIFLLPDYYIPMKKQLSPEKRKHVIYLCVSFQQYKISCFCKVIYHPDSWRYYIYIEDDLDI
jgi:hypothetical protein